jgi:hypothetical protein
MTGRFLRLCLPLLDRLEEVLNDANALSHFSRGGHAQPIVTEGLKLGRSVAKNLTDTFPNLQFDFCLRSVLIGKSFLTKIADGR